MVLRCEYREKPPPHYHNTLTLVTAHNQVFGVAREGDAVDGGRHCTPTKFPHLN
jgi:hypothetical protein